MCQASSASSTCSASRPSGSALLLPAGAQAVAPAGAARPGAQADPGAARRRPGARLMALVPGAHPVQRQPEELDLVRLGRAPQDPEAQPLRRPQDAFLGI